ncbi:discoidin domain-containing protein [Kitasatospora sp. NPDC003701]
MDLLRGKPVTASGFADVYRPDRANDGDRASYWESANNAFPQWITGDLGSPVVLGRVVLALPAGWEARTETLTVQGSTDGASWTAVKPSAGYRFDPATGNTVTVQVTGTTARYLRLTFTGNTGWPAGQLSEFQVYGP